MNSNNLLILNLLKLERVRRRSFAKSYQPRGNAKRLFSDLHREVILTGPTRTGKSLGCLQSIYKNSQRYENFRGLIIRKERSTLSETGLVTFERDCLGFDHPLVVDGPRRQFRHAYNFSNGSTIVVAGLDKPGKVLSSEYDQIYVQQAEEISEEDWETLITRLSGRSLPQEKQQIIADCNPMSPMHWIYVRGTQRNLQLWETYHQDNPLLWDAEKKDWTTYGKVYIDSLTASLTGTTRDRLLKGLWVAAEGLVYSDFALANITEEEPDLTRDSDGNLVYPIEVGFDDGYIDPRAILFVQRRPTDILFFDEIYHTKHLAAKCVGEVIQKSVKLSGIEIPDELTKQPLEQQAVWCRENKVQLPALAVGSPEAKELQGQFRQADIPARFKTFKVTEGIAIVRGLILDENDRRTLKVHRRCSNLLRELQEEYRHPKGVKAGTSEKPEDGNDHACEAMRYWIQMRGR